MSDEKPSEDLQDRYARVQAEHYQQTLTATVAKVHAIAERMAREGEARPMFMNDDGMPDYNYAVQQVIHELHWGMANLNMDTLMSAAADAHNAARARFK